MQHINPLEPLVASTSAPDTKMVVPHAAKAWEFFRKWGSPKYHVAPMVDQVLLSSNTSGQGCSAAAD